MLDNFYLPNYLFCLLCIIILIMRSLKNIFIVSYENLIQCKIKCKSKQTGVQKDFYVFISWRILQRQCGKKRLSCKNIFLYCLQKCMLVGYVVCKNIIIPKFLTLYVYKHKASRSRIPRLITLCTCYINMVNKCVVADCTSGYATGVYYGYETGMYRRVFRL